MGRDIDFDAKQKGSANGEELRHVNTGNEKGRRHMRIGQRTTSAKNIVLLRMTRCKKYSKTSVN